MNKKLLLGLVLVFFGLAIFIYGYAQQDQDTMQNNTIQNNPVQNVTQNSTTQNGEQTNVNSTLKDYDAIIIQKRT
jgi:lipopolysaccharide export LptBFGC system permease protein LptF